MPGLRVTRVLQSETVRGVFAILGAFIMFLTCSVQNYWGSVSVYYDSYLYNQTGRLDLPASPLPLALYLGSSYVTMLCAGIGVLHVSRKLILVAGLAIYTLGNVCNYLTLSSAWVLGFNASFFVLGSGFGFVCSTGLLYAIDWGGRYVGMASAFVTAGLPIGASTIIKVLTVTINPNNIAPDLDTGVTKIFTQAEVVDKVLPSLFALYCAMLALQCVGVCLLREKPKAASVTEYTRLPDGEGESLSETKIAYNGGNCVDNPQGEDSIHGTGHSNNQGDGGNAAAKTWSQIRVILRMRVFYVLFFLNGIICTSFLSFLTNFKVFGIVYISDDQFLSDIGTAANLVSLGARCIWAPLMDKLISPKTTQVIYCSGTSILFATYVTAAMVWQTWFAMWSVLFGFLLGSVFLFETLTALTYFGRDLYPIGYGMLLVSEMFVTLIFPIVQNLLLDAAGWSGVFLTQACVMFLASVVAIVFLPERPS